MASVAGGILDEIVDLIHGGASGAGKERFKCKKSVDHAGMLTEVHINTLGRKLPAVSLRLRGHQIMLGCDYQSGRQKVEILRIRWRKIRLSARCRIG